MREAGVVAAMKSPNLVPIFDMEFEIQRCYMVMELADTDLYSHIRKTRGLPPDETKDIMWDILMGLRTMHEHMYLHRDIKPDNILLKEGKAMISDFGLSRNVLFGSQRLTPIVGSLSYRPIEILLGTDKYNGAVDIWSVG